MTTNRKKELLKEFAELIKYVDGDYLPHLPGNRVKLSNLAFELGVKPISMGCSGCVLPAAKALFQQLRDYPTNDPVKKKEAPAETPVKKRRGNPNFGKKKPKKSDD